jgi:hypothetical protein
MCINEKNIEEKRRVESQIEYQIDALLDNSIAEENEFDEDSHENPEDQHILNPPIFS